MSSLVYARGEQGSFKHSNTHDTDIEDVTPRDVKDEDEDEEEVWEDIEEEEEYHGSDDEDDLDDIGYGEEVFLPGDKNDLEDLFAIPVPNIALKTVTGKLTVEETAMIVDTMGKIVVNVGDTMSLLHMAVDTRMEAVAEYLLSRGHPTEVKTAIGETPLDRACWRGFENEAIILLKAGANIDCVTEAYYTPLHRCAFYGHVYLAAVLTILGANRTIKDHEGKTAYDVAVEKGNEDLIKILAPKYKFKDTTLSLEKFRKCNRNNPEYNRTEWVCAMATRKIVVVRLFQLLRIDL